MNPKLKEFGTKRVFDNLGPLRSCDDYKKLGSNFF